MFNKKYKARILELEKENEELRTNERIISQHQEIISEIEDLLQLIFISLHLI